MPSTLVLGAGELGLSVLRALAQSPSRQSSTITVLLRPSTLAKNPHQVLPQELGINAQAGDIAAASVSELGRLFAPYDVVIGCSGMLGPPGLQKKICEAVLQARVKRYFPWQFGVDYDVIGRGSAQDLFSEQLGVRDMLRAQMQTQWVIVSTGMFMGFLFEEAFEVVVGGKEGEGRKVRALGGRDNKVTVTAVEDIGRVVAELVYAASDVQGVVFTAGQTISYGELAEAMREVLGDEVRLEEWDLKTLRSELAEDPGNGLKKYRVVFAEGKGVWWDEEKSWDKQRNMKLKSVKEWIEGNLVVKR